MINRHQQMFYPIPVWNPDARVVVQWTVSSAAIVLATPSTYEDGEGVTRHGTSMLIIGQAGPVMAAIPYADVSQWLIAPGGVNPILPDARPASSPTALIAPPRQP